MTNFRMGAGEQSLATAALWAVASAAQAQLLFTEDFNDGSAALRWSVVSQQEAGGSAPPDGSVDFAFDYSILGISSPSGVDTLGAFVQVNKTDQAGNEGESYSIYPNGASFSGPFYLEADMYVYNNGSAGSTEFGMAGTRPVPRHIRECNCQ